MYNPNVGIFLVLGGPGNVSVFKHASFEIEYKLFKTYSMPLYGITLHNVWGNYMSLGENV